MQHKPGTALWYDNKVIKSTIWQGILQNYLLSLPWLTEFVWERLELFYFDNISAEDVNLLLLKQTYKSPYFFLRLGAFCRAGSDKQAQQSTHLAEGLHPL